jgi:eukaryotic-like serine/threonine-protein kinase
MHATTLPRGSADVVTLTPRRGGPRYGDYAVLQPIARGGMSAVYLAIHRTTGERVALKVLDSRYATCAEAVERLHAEHALASRARHPGVLAIRASGWTADRVPYLVMEHLTGATLGAIVDRGPLDQPTSVAMCAQAAAALAALHDAGVIHCDVKHDNLFVTEDRRVVVIDFGVSRLADEPPRPDPTIAGTPWCIAPEQWRGAPVPASDVYALGCLLYELVCGAPPFDGAVGELMVAHLERRPARPSWLCPLPIALERLILRALAKAPADRPTMRELAAALAALADAGPAAWRAAG